LRACFARARWPPDARVEQLHAAWAADQIRGDARGFDVVHAHVPSLLPFGERLDAPLIYTVHHDDGPEHAHLRALYRRSRAQLIAISARQKRLIPELARARVIHHGLDAARYRPGAGDGGYVAYLGRIAADKGVHHAIDAARAAGVPIRVAGAPHWGDGEYFTREIAPRLRSDGVRAIGEVGGDEKHRLLGDARALLFPIEWEEPFGLVMIEAMLSGTPVLAFPRGAATEVIDNGVTGFLCRDVAELTRRLRRLDGFDRVACCRRARARWTTQRMVRDHLAAYAACERGIEDGRAAETVA
jgi:glycosyltransferase involved in cell wall biosynthesis